MGERLAARSLGPPRSAAANHVTARQVSVAQVTEPTDATPCREARRARRLAADSTASTRGHAALTAGRADSAHQARPGSARANTSWSSSRRSARATPVPSGCPAHPPAGGWQTNGGYAASGIAGTMPRPGLCRVSQIGSSASGEAKEALALCIRHSRRAYNPLRNARS